MSRPLDDALNNRESVVRIGFDIYEPLGEHPALVYTREELEALLSHELATQSFSGPLRTRSKSAKEAVCRALGYPVPSSFQRVRPRFPGQDLDVHVQKHDNLQIWNDELSPTRRYALIRVDEAGHVLAVRVAEGAELAPFDRTGTVTTKYQARRRRQAGGSLLVSRRDTRPFVAELEPVDNLPATTLRGLLPAKQPVAETVLSVKGLYDRLLHLVGMTIPYHPSERARGEQLHRLACEVLELGDYADTGRFPDIVCQALEVKLQTSPTIDLGLISPDSEDPAITLSPLLRHCDARYLVAYAEHTNDVFRIEHVVVSTGIEFFTEFERFGGLVRNRKLQFHLPKGFFG